MNYITSSPIPVNYTIPTTLMANSVLGQYHLEVHSLSTNVKTLVQASTITPATSTVPGLVEFGSVAFANSGTYLLTVCYASNADLDTAAVTVATVARATVQRVVALSDIAV